MTPTTISHRHDPAPTLRGLIVRGIAFAAMLYLIAFIPGLIRLVDSESVVTVAEVGHE